jgi:TPR repeat protein
MTALGDLYSSGTGVTQDLNQASIWYRAAAGLSDAANSSPVQDVTETAPAAGSQ